ncbi:MAG TPA: protein kinase [Kofleriaceae bacterium]|nr:protein kinase [Kofleriaceae bacterium]
MSCREFDPLIARRATLPEPDRRALDDHLATCPDCRETAELFGAAPASSSAELPRVDAGVYIKERVLGEGGMGTTYLAWDLRLERMVAIKEPRLPDDPDRRRELLARFAQEARLTAHLQHPSIVTVYEAGYRRDADGEHLYYTMEPVDGVPLQVEIEKRATLEARLELLPHLTTIANAVAYAHERGVVHRDIKPANVLIGSFGEAVLIDWGIAKEIDAGGSPLDGAGDDAGLLTRAGAGTANYMPPEQATGAAVDPRLDVYALGATIYHLLAGVPPYDGPEVRLRLLTGAPRPLEELEPRAPRELISIVGKAMARDPDARFANAKEVARELARFQAGQLVESHAHTTGELVRRWMRRHRTALVAAALALVAIAAVSAYSISRVLASRRDAIAARATAEDEAAHANSALARALGAEALGKARPLTAATFFAKVWRSGDHRGAMRLALGRALDRARNEPRAIRISREELQGAYPLGDDVVTATPHAVLVIDRKGATRAQRTFDEPVFAVDPAAARIAVGANGGVAVILSPQLDDRVVLAGAPADADFLSIELSPGGQLAAAGDEHGRVFVWSARTGHLEHTLVVADQEGITALAFASERELAVVTDDQKSPGVWSIDDGKLVRRLDGHTSIPASVRLDHLRARLVTGAPDGTEVWDARTGERRSDLYYLGGDRVYDAAFSPDDAIIAAASERTLQLWRARDGMLLGTLDGQEGEPASVAFDGADRIITADDDGVLRVWRPSPDGVVVGAVEARDFPSAAIAAGGPAAATADERGVTVMDLAGARAPVRVPLAKTSSVALGADGCTLAAIDHDGVHVVAVCGGAPVERDACSIDASVGPVRGLRADGGTAIIYGERGWQRGCHEPVHGWCPGCTGLYVNLSNGARAVLGTPSGQVVVDLDRDLRWPCRDACERAAWYIGLPGDRVVLGDNNQFAVLDLASGSTKTMSSLPGNEKLQSFAVYPDGSAFAVANARGVVTIFDVDTGQELFAIQASAEAIDRIAFAPDGGALYVLADDGAVRRFDFPAPPPQAELDAQIAELVRARRAEGDRIDVPSVGSGRVDDELPAQPR